MYYLQQILPNKDNLNITIKYNWNGNDLIQLQNLYLAEDFVKFQKVNDFITFISGLCNIQFIQFFDNLSTMISSIINDFPVIYSLNGKINDVYGISGIIINDELYLPNEQNKYIINIGDYLSGNTKLVYTFNNISGNVLGVSTINNILPNNGYINLGNYKSNDINVVESINGLTGNVTGITGFIVNNYLLYYNIINGGHLNLTYNIQDFMSQFNFLYVSGDTMYGVPSASDISDQSPPNAIANVKYFKEKTNGLMQIQVKTFNSNDNTNNFYWEFNRKKCTFFYSKGFYQILNIYIINQSQQIELLTIQNKIKSYSLYKPKALCQKITIEFKENFNDVIYVNILIDPSLEEIMNN